MRLLSRCKQQDQHHPSLHYSMVSSKRKHVSLSDSEEASDWAVNEPNGQSSEDDDVDISSALLGRREKAHRPEVDMDDDDDQLQELIRNSIAKRNVKGGTELLKKTKGKAKIMKGEVGGGSFQSMGTLRPRRCITICLRLFVFKVFIRGFCAP